MVSATPPMNAASPATVATSMGSALATGAPRLAGAALRAALRGKNAQWISVRPLAGAGGNPG